MSTVTAETGIVARVGEAVEWTIAAVLLAPMIAEDLVRKAGGWSYSAEASQGIDELEADKSKPTGE